MKSPSLFLSVSLSCLVLSQFAVADCNDELKDLKPDHPVHVNALGEEDQGEALKRDNAIVTKVAVELGLLTTSHQLNLVPSGQLDLMAAAPGGAHPAPHWQEGAEVLGALEGIAGVLEFVTPGCPTCRSYYSSSTPPTEQRSILMHVAGHNDMALTSRYIKNRPGDGPMAGYQLAEILLDAYRNHDHDEVALYYQYLKSLEHLQDFTFGTFEDPAKFKDEPLSSFSKFEKKSFWDHIQQQHPSFMDALTGKTRKAQPNEIFPGWKKTYSVLQALTENLPTQAPEWQRDILRLFEQSRRQHVGVFQTKIMNEGWATLMMYILARHLPWTTSRELVKFGQLLSGVTYRSFENPYWLGLSGWWNMYEQYVERPEIKGLDAKEQDKRFIAWAREMYANKNDSEWTRAVLDERWIEKHNFFLYRQTRPEEIDRDKDPEKQKYIALSRNWKRIRNFLIAKHVDSKYRYFPSISLRNPGLTSGFVTFVQENTEMGLPLDLASAVKTSFAIAQVMKAPVRLEALFVGQGPPPPRSLPNIGYGPYFNFPQPEPPRLIAVKGALTVFADGSVKSEIPNSITNEALEAVINDYKDDILASYHDELGELMTKQWTKLATDVGNVNSVSANRIVEFAPQTAGAFREYLQVVELRLRKSIISTLNGKAPPRFGRKGIQVRVLAEIPHYSYARGFAEYLTSQKPVGPVDYPVLPTNHDFDVDENGSIVGTGPHLPGEKFGKEPKDENGQGQGQDQGQGDEQGQGQGQGEGDGIGEGQGDGQGEPGEGDGGEGQSNGENEGNGYGSGSGSPQVLNIPLKLYGDILAEVLELPNIRRTRGKNLEMQTIRRGSVKKPAGNLIWDQTLMVAIEKARALRKGKNLPHDSSVPTMQLVQEALPLIEPSDYVVSSRMEKPLPDFDAVLVVNVDLTGSMGGDRIAIAKNLVFNMKALLAAKYKNVVIHYVGFDGSAKELTEKEIFSQFFGGGTNYTSAIEVDKSILEKYDNSRFNKYVVTIGDGETSAPDAESYVQGIRDMKDDLQYAGFALTNEAGRDSSYSDAIIKAHERLKMEWEWVGIAVLQSAKDMFQGLKDLFPQGNGGG